MDVECFKCGTLYNDKDVVVTKVGWFCVDCFKRMINDERNGG